MAKANGKPAKQNGKVGAKLNGGFGSLAVEWRDAARVIPYEGNPRSIPEVAIDKVASSIREFGWQQPIVVDRAGVVIVGHTRLKAAVKLGQPRVPVVVADLTPAKARAYRLADNRTNEETSWLDDLLANELRELRDEEVDLSALGFDDAEIDKLLGELAGPTQFGEYDESIPVEHTCPKCGYQWSGGAGKARQAEDQDSEGDEA